MRNLPLILVLCLSSCVLKSKHDETLAIYTQTYTQLGDIKTQNEALKKYVANLEQKNSDLTLRNDDLSQTNLMLAEKNKNMAQSSLEDKRLALQVSSYQHTLEKKSENSEQISEKLSKDLLVELEKQEITLRNENNEIILTLSNALIFNEGSFKISPYAKTLLDKIVKAAPRLSMRVQGHTDNVAIGGAIKKRFLTNWDLSSYRAIRILEQLILSGVAKERVVAIGYGAERPIADNATRLGREKNRRIEIVLELGQQTPFVPLTQEP